LTKRVRILLLVLAALAVAAVVIVPSAVSSGDGREALGLTEFEARLDAGEVDTVKLYDASNELS
jgi:hypothetical protein